MTPQRSSIIKYWKLHDIIVTSLFFIMLNFFNNTYGKKLWRIEHNYYNLLCYYNSFVQKNIKF